MIRPATPADIQTLIELSIEALSIDKYDELVISRERVFQSVQECVCSAKNFSWVSEVDGIVQGGLGAVVMPFMFYERNQAVVVMWYSRKANGDGMALMREFMRWAKSKPMIKQVVYGGERGADSRVGKLANRAGFNEVLPMYVMTR